MDSTMTIILIILSSFLGLISLYLKIFRNKSLSKKVLPGPKCSKISLCYSLVSGMYSYRKLGTDLILCGILQMCNGLCLLYERERIFQLFINMTPLVFFYKPETVEAILSNPAHIEKPKQYNFLNLWLGTGLLTSSGKKWRTRRKLLTSSFHFRILEEFVPIFNKQSSILVSKLLEQESTWIDIVPLMTSCTLDIICETAMGLSINAQRGGCSEYTNAIHEIGGIFLIRICRPWLYSDFLFNLSPTGRKFNKNLKIVHAITRKVIKEKKEEMLKALESKANNNPSESAQDSSKKYNIFLEILLTHHFKDSSFTEEDIREEVDTFMFAGHDTTAMAVCFTLFCLGLDDNKTVLRRVHEELDEIFDGNIEREITRGDINRMQYLECVLKETLRLYPSAPIFGREVKERFQVGDYTLAKGTFCLVSPAMLHRDPVSFPNPEKFDPERFFPENVSRRHPYAYIPFSAGPRNCIGQKFAIMEGKTLLANVLRNFTVVSKDPRDKVNVLSNIVIKNLDPVLLNFQSRSFNESQQ